MTNTDKIVAATRKHVGHTLSAKMVQALVLAQFPDTNPASIMVSDHAGANSKGITYCDQVFDRSATGYVVRAEVVRKPKTARSKQSTAGALIAANALLQVNVAQGKAIVVPPPAPTNGAVQAKA